MLYRISSLLLAGSVTALLFAQPPTVGKCTIFPANDIWNTPIDNLPVSPQSAAYISSSGPGVGLHPDFGSGTWEGEPIGIPFVTVPGSQTKYPAYFTFASESDPGPYAIPLNAPLQGGPYSTGDRHAIAIDTDNCVLYEMWSAYPQAASWIAGSGAIFNLNSSALRPNGWTSSNAAGMPNFSGLVRYDEILAGEIRHAINFTLAYTQAAHVWPARHDAGSANTNLAPMGQRFRLRANFDISGFSRTNQIILRAMKKYGLILNDNGANWFIAGVPDSRWDNSDLRQLGLATGGDFEAVDVSSLMVDPNSGATKTVATAPSGGTSNSAFTPIRINAGGATYTDLSGTVWTGDSSYAGGSSFGTSNGVSGTNGMGLYQTSRWGDFTYSFSVPNGSYDVKLKFAELYMSWSGMRLFNVAINGGRVLNNFDIVAEAGATLQALDKTFPVTVTNGRIDIAFTGGSQNFPSVNAIEVTASSAPPPAPSNALFRVNAGGGNYTDPNGVFWTGDSSYIGGNSYGVSYAVGSTNAWGLYQTSRWGNFTYTFNVPNGSYIANLKFAEPYVTGPGMRLFHVYINGSQTLSNFDIFAASGGFMKALDKPFPVNVTNGQIQIAFTQGSQNWPTVSAIEIYRSDLGSSAPAGPTDPSGGISQPGVRAVSLNWAASSSPNIRGYNVYRGALSGGPYVRLNSTPVGDVSYTDDNVSTGETYYYVCTALDASNNESSYSNQAQALVQ